MSGDAIQIVRSVYTFWDFLADVGGLIDMFKILVNPLVAFINMLVGTGLSRFLL